MEKERKKTWKRSKKDSRMERKKDETLGES